MSVFTPVSRQRAEAWLTDYAVGPLLALEGVAAGIENTNYFLTTTQGRYVLTLFEKLGAADLPYFLGLMAHLSRHGIPCPAPVATRGNAYLGKLCGKPACLVTRLDGASVEAPSPAQCAAVGKTLAALHLAGRGYPAAMANPRGPRWWREGAAPLAPHLGPDEAALLAEELRFQGRHGGAELPRGVIHGDLFRDNVLFLGDAVSGVIDFYFACDDAWLYDLAIAANDWCVAGAPEAGLDRERARAMLRGYQGVRPVGDAERAAWPALLRAAALRFWLSRLWERHFPRRGEMIFTKDPEHFERLLRYHVGCGDASHAYWN